MIPSILPPARSPRPGGAAKASGDPAAKPSDAVAAQHQAFDVVQAENAELQRELAALDDMLMAQLKNDDEILKKWIAMI